jgi:hypothetical protein
MASNQAWHVGWRKLPPGYAIPGMSRDGQPITPLCGHARPVPGSGWQADCDAPAEYARPFTDSSEEYACAIHAGGADAEDDLR